MPCSSVSIVHFEHVIADWDVDWHADYTRDFFWNELNFIS